MKNETRLLKLIEKLNKVKDQQAKEPSLEYKKSLQNDIETYELLVNYRKGLCKISLNKSMKYRLHRIMCRRNFLRDAQDNKAYDQMSARWEKFVSALMKLNPTFSEEQVREFTQEKYTEFKNELGV